MVVEVVLAAVGLGLLTVAADHLVLGSSRLAARLRVRPVVVGVVVIGLGTSAPEFLVSGVAAARGDTGIALGNIAGSNILNLTLILGVAGLIAPFAVASTVIRREVPLAVAAVAVFGLLASVGLSRWAAAALVAASLFAVWLLLRWAGEGRNAEVVRQAAEYAADTDTHATVPPARQPGHRTVWIEPVRAILGLAGVLAGAQLLVASASSAASRLGVPQVIIGFTVVALGTSLPELVTTVQAMRRRESDLVVGNLFGSNLFNSLAGGAVVALAAPAGKPATIGAMLSVAMVATAVLASVLLRRGFVLSRLEGGLLLGVYLLIMPLLLVA